MAEATPKTFTIRGVMGPAFRVLFRNLVPFGFIAAVIQGIPYLVLLAVYPDLSGGVQNEEVDVSGEFTFGAEAGGWTFLFFILSHFVTATLVYGAVQDLRAQRASVIDCFRRALVVIVPVLGVAILISLAILAAGLVAAIPGMAILATLPMGPLALVVLPAMLVPTVIVAIMLYVTVPVVVIERPGVIQSLRRSVQLTKGHRWTLLWILAPFALLYGLAGGIWQAITPMTPALDVLVELAIEAFFSVVFAVLSGVAYFNLRYVKEDVDLDEIAAVFD